MRLEVSNILTTYVVESFSSHQVGCQIYSQAQSKPKNSIKCWEISIEWLKYWFEITVSVQTDLQMGQRYGGLLTKSGVVNKIKGSL